MLDPLMKSWYRHFPVQRIVPYSISIVLLVFRELDDVLDKLQQGLSQAARLLVETIDTSGDESVISPRRKKVRKSCQRRLLR